VAGADRCRKFLMVQATAAGELSTHLKIPR
jgi:hypothetical protein